MAGHHRLFDPYLFSPFPAARLPGTEGHEGQRVKVDYLLHILILINIYIILVVSLDLIAGCTGPLSIAHAAFYAIGAYFTALLSLYFQTNFLFNMVFGIVGAAILEVIIAFPSIRIHDDYFVIGGVLASVAGNLYAHYITFIDPTSFTILESILVISMVIIGGAGSLRGPVLGAVVLVILPGALRFIGLPSAVAANLRQIFYGSLLVLMMLYRPQGLVGEFNLQK